VKSTAGAFDWAKRGQQIRKLLRAEKKTTQGGASKKKKPNGRGTNVIEIRGKERQGELAEGQNRRRIERGASGC